MYICITLVTDFGLEDDFVGVCHGVIAGIAPDARVIDVTHGIPPQDVQRGALVLAQVTPYLPVGVHVAVVDPGVGSARRGVAIRTGDGRAFVGPDNGLLTRAADAAGIVDVRELTEGRFHLERVSRTFHARDVFSPVAAHLAAGARFADLGRELDPATLVRLDLPEPEVGSAALRATILSADRFGNLQLNVAREHVDAAGLAAGDRVELAFVRDTYFAQVADTFADAVRGELILYEDSYGAFAIAISGGDAGALTGAGSGDTVRITPARE